MVATRDATIEVDRVQNRRFGRLDIALLVQLAIERGDQRLALFDTAPRQMPAGDVGMFDQEDAAFAIENQAAHADGETARVAPIGVQKPADCRLERTADGLKT